MLTRYMTMGFPNFLTFLRIGMIPGVVGACYQLSPIWWGLATLLFGVACLTDYADGYMARRYGPLSPLGAYLDPLADKLLVVSVLFVLAGFHVIEGVHLIPGMLIVVREYILSGMRNKKPLRVSLAVNIGGKIKTFFQMTALGLLMTSQALPPWKHDLQQIGLYALWIASILTVITGVNYIRKWVLQMRKAALLNISKA